jgi:hypothetical protein
MTPFLTLGERVQCTQCNALSTLDYANLSGSIPPELGNLSGLTDLWLFRNQLSGKEIRQLIDGD